MIHVSFIVSLLRSYLCPEVVIRQCGKGFMIVVFSVIGMSTGFF